MGSEEAYRRYDVGNSVIVSTAKEEATKIGIEIIKDGGNAIDAAVAVGFAIGVCEPNASGIGGGGFMTVRKGHTGEVFCIDFREVAPTGASPNMWKTDEHGDILDDEKGTGGKAICVPGEVAGLIYALENYGTMPLKKVMSPSIELAEKGFKVTSLLEGDIKDCEEKFLKYGGGKDVYLKNGLPYTQGEIFRNPFLAKTLRIISEMGRDGFYKGKVAQSIVTAVKDAGGYMTLEDLKNYKVNVYSPICGQYRGYEIISTPPPSSGGTHVVQMLNILENFNVKSMEVNSAQYIHVLSEIFKISLADRAEYMGDMNFVDVPIKGLTSKSYGKKLSNKINEEICLEYNCHDPWKYESSETTHFSIGDADGNMVSVTKTISGFFGSGVVTKDTGIVLNNQMRGFAKGHGKKNSVIAGKKPLSSMSPTLILKENKPFAILGTPGGAKIISTVVQVISKLVDHKMSLKEAVYSPRIFNDMNNELLFENRISQNTINQLKSMGHKVNPLGQWDRKMGSVQSVLYKSHGEMEGVADPRRDGVVMGY